MLVAVLVLPVVVVAPPVSAAPAPAPSRRVAAAQRWPSYASAWWTNGYAEMPARRRDGRRAGPTAGRATATAQNEPLFIRPYGDYADDPLKLHYAIYTALDMLEAKCAARDAASRAGTLLTLALARHADGVRRERCAPAVAALASTRGAMDVYLGLLSPTEEFRMYAGGRTAAASGACVTANTEPHADTATSRTVR